MGNDFRGNRDSRGGGRRPFNRGGFGGNNRGFDRGGGNRGDRQMYKAVCANCGKDCEVPFRPSNNKPVYCNDCFEKMGGGGRERQNDRPSFPDRRPQGGSDNAMGLKGEIASLNNKLDRILSLLESKKPQAKAESVKAVEPATEIKAETPKIEEEVKEILETESLKVKKASKKKAASKK